MKLVQAQAYNIKVSSEVTNLIDLLQQAIEVARGKTAWRTTATGKLQQTSKDPELKKKIIQLIQEVGAEIAARIDAPAESIVAYTLANYIDPKVLVKAACKKDPAAAEAAQGEDAWLLAIQTETTEQLVVDLLPKPDEPAAECAAVLEGVKISESIGSESDESSGEWSSEDSVDAYTPRTLKNKLRDARTDILIAQKDTEAKTSQLLKAVERAAKEAQKVQEAHSQADLIQESLDGEQVKTAALAEALAQVRSGRYRYESNAQTTVHQPRAQQSLTRAPR